jgi:hypothetical protein
MVWHHWCHLSRYLPAGVSRQCHISALLLLLLLLQLLKLEQQLPMSTSCRLISSWQ